MRGIHRGAEKKEHHAFTNKSILITFSFQKLQTEITWNIIQRANISGIYGLNDASMFIFIFNQDVREISELFME